MVTDQFSKRVLPQISQYTHRERMFGCFVRQIFLLFFCQSLCPVFLQPQSYRGRGDCILYGLLGLQNCFITVLHSWLFCFMAAGRAHSYPIFVNKIRHRLLTFTILQGVQLKRVAKLLYSQGNYVINLKQTIYIKFVS